MGCGLGRGTSHAAHAAAHATAHATAHAGRIVAWRRATRHGRRTRRHGRCLGRARTPNRSLTLTRTRILTRTRTLTRTSPSPRGTRARTRAPTGCGRRSRPHCAICTPCSTRRSPRPSSDVRFAAPVKRYTNTIFARVRADRIWCYRVQLQGTLQLYRTYRSSSQLVSNIPVVDPPPKTKAEVHVYTVLRIGEDW